jgi:hypothetical protein
MTTLTGQTAKRFHEEAAKQTPEKWLLVLPASGVAQRLFGSLVCFDMDGIYTPFIVVDGAAVMVDPRITIYRDDNLERVWEPRKFIDKIHPLAREWFNRNPDVSNPATGGGLRHM